MSRIALSAPTPNPPSEKTYALGIQACGGVWLSGLTATRVDAATGIAEVAGDLIEQAAATLDKIENVLRPSRRTLSDITSIVQYVPPAAVPDLSKLRQYYTTRLGPNPPLTNTVVVTRLLRSKALIEIESVLGRSVSSKLVRLPAVGGRDLEDARQTAEKLLNQHHLSWSDVCKATEFVSAGTSHRAATTQLGPDDSLQIFMPRVGVTGQGAEIHLVAHRQPNDPLVFASAVGDPSVGGIAEQCAHIYKRLERKLADAGASLDEVVKTTEYVTAEALKDYKLTADVRRRTFSPPYPAATGVICEGFSLPGAQIAVEVVAAGKLHD